MKKELPDAHSLLAKQHRSLAEHLQEARELNSIQSRYIPNIGRREGESNEAFASRLRQNASSYQFVQVIFNGAYAHVAFGVSGPIVTRQGRFMLLPAALVNGRWGWHYLLFSPDFETVLKEKEIFLRLDSGCLIGQMFGDITCDCREQFEISLSTCAQSKAGVVITTPSHDGRGWNEFKMANQQLMDECGLDTVAAARIFYGDDDIVDQRTYTEVVLVLRALGFGHRHQFSLATNNPRKIATFQALGLPLKDSHPVVVKNANPILRRNLLAKCEKWGHNFGAQLI